MKNILFIIPTINEASTIAELCVEVLNTDPSWHILVIDDGSSDGTDNIIRKLALSQNGRLSIIERGKRLGIGSAHKVGLSNAITKGFNFAITMDADGSHEVSFASDLVNACNEADISIGSRYLSKKSLDEWSTKRKILTYGVHFLTKFSLNLNYDNSSGYRAYKISSMAKLNLDSIKSNNYDFFFESLLFFKHSEMDIRQVPIKLPKRTYGHSKLSVSLAFSALYTLFKLIVRYRIIPFMQNKKKNKSLNEG